ncbi:MAG: xanthine dehydrogenase family protein subunit M [Planctomycetes bacterium]|nr:xanthine dehydrogenase family protein subunit M [Planctomycetota bacterium]
MGYDYIRPASLEQALSLAAQGESALIAGGTDLLVALHKKKRPAPGRLISIRSLPELAGIRDEGARLRIGAAVPLADLLAHPAQARLPALAKALGVMGSRQIRNVATLGGTLCNASPGADAAPPLLALGAGVELAGPAGRRTLDLAEFFRGPGRTALQPGEIMTAVLVPWPGAGTQSHFLRRSRVAMDIATVSLAACFGLTNNRLSGVRLAAGAVAPVPLRLRATETFLEGKALTDETLAEAAKLARADVAPISDLRGTAWYRRELVGVFLARALRAGNGGKP